MKKKLSFLLSLFLLLGVFFSAVPVEAAGFHIDFPLNCQAAELVNLDTGTVVYQKNADARREPASLTKIMTFIVVSEQIKDLKGTQITVGKKILQELSGTGSSMSGIKVGDVATAYQLLNCMMVPSGNDAALTLADYVGKGSLETFTSLMNAKAKALGCTNTHFTNPHGLHDPNHYTSASDMAKITRCAMSLPYFVQICSQTSYLYKPVSGPNSAKGVHLYTTNLLISKNSSYYYPYAKGIKTGHTDESGYCLVSTASDSHYSYLCVAMGAPSVDKNGKSVRERGEMKDSANLYHWAFKSLALKQIVSSDDSLAEVKLKYAWKQDKLLLKPQKNYSALLPKDVTAGSILVSKKIPDSVSAPVKKGQVVGTATLSYANQPLATINLVASESVERSELLHTTDVIKSIFTSTWFLVIAAIIILLVIIYIILAIIYNRRRKKLRRVKRYRRM